MIKVARKTKCFFFFKALYINPKCIFCCKRVWTIISNNNISWSQKGVYTVFVTLEHIMAYIISAQIKRKLFMLCVTLPRGRV